MTPRQTAAVEALQEQMKHNSSRLIRIENAVDRLARNIEQLRKELR